MNHHATTPLSSLVLCVACLGLAATAAEPETTNTPAGVYPIDLPTTLQLVEAQNYKVALAREQVNQARARQRQAQYRLIPTLRLGASYYYQDGPLQDTAGTVQDVTRSGAYGGFGAGAVGAGTVARPGLAISADLADAIYEPLAAKQERIAAEAGGEATRQQEALRAVSAYFDLVLAKGRLAVTEDSVRLATDLAELTAQWAEAGSGLQSDAERAAVEKLLAQQQLAQGREELKLASIRLARLLRLENLSNLFPMDDPVALTLPFPQRSEEELYAVALASRPEVKRSEALVAAAKKRLNQSRYGFLIPNLAVGVSGGAFGGDTSSSPDGFDGRVDVAGGLYWEIEGLGFSEVQRTKERKANMASAELQMADELDFIRSQVSMALARLDSARAQQSVTELATQRAERSYDADRERVYENKGLPLEALQALQALTRAREAYLGAIMDFNKAQFELFTAIGQPADDVWEQVSRVNPVP